MSSDYFSTYKRILSSYGRYDGEVRKNQTDEIEDATWWEDINSRVAYLYDFYHDKDVRKLINLDSNNDDNKTPIDIKFITNSSQTYDKDVVTHHIQLRPRQKCNVDYYEEVYSSIYNSIFPLGLYIDIPDEQGLYNRWLVVAKADYYDTQFPTFLVLPCDYTFQWIYNNTKYEMAGCLRSQNS